MINKKGFNVDSDYKELLLEELMTQADLEEQEAKKGIEDHIDELDGHLMWDVYRCQGCDPRTQFGGC